MREHSVNDLDNFIGGWYADDTRFCDEIVDYFEASDKFQGYVVVNDNVHVDKNHKDSLEVFLNNNPSLLFKYHDNLKQALSEYIKKYPVCNNYCAFGDVEHTKIQKYPPNGGYYQWHTERCSDMPTIASRHLVFMTYLNDITIDGETEFWHQKIKVKPEKGLTLIWGSDWTFTHRGLPSPQEKYIVTGWLSFNSKF